MFGLGMSEIIFLGILALIVIGPKELPELARTLGRFLNELKRSTNVLGEELKSQTGLDRIHFNEPPSPVAPTVDEESPAQKVEPEQMELVEQTKNNEILNDKKEE